MYKDINTQINKQLFGFKENHFRVNKTVKAVIINFNDERGDIIVRNNNYGIRRKYADFTEGKKEAGLHPMQIVFSGLESAIMFKQKYIGSDNQVHVFNEDLLRKEK